MATTSVDTCTGFRITTEHEFGPELHRQMMDRFSQFIHERPAPVIAADGSVVADKIYDCDHARKCPFDELGLPPFCRRKF